jgi:hypothetical protein
MLESSSARITTRTQESLTERRGMPITPFLHGERVEPETRRVISVALEMVCIALRTGDCDDFKQAIATKLIALAKAGERNPDILREEVLKDIRPKAHVHAMI